MNTNKNNNQNNNKNNNASGKSVRPFIYATAVAVGLFAAQAQATVLTAHFNFTADVLAPADIFVVTSGLSSGDLISGSAIFDDTGATGVGLESFELINASDFLMSIGAINVDAADDIDFGDVGLPSIDFLDGNFLRFQYLADIDVGGNLYEVSLEEVFEVVAPTGQIVMKNADRLSVTVVPVPAALPLMLSALGGLAVWRRRRM